ncbi:MAG: STAS domain-containing protein [Candidatus Wallbacteria bacterium]|nr:STAS domain-containing protein [Candidatus Wallbacteria bacterium]
MVISSRSIDNGEHGPVTVISLDGELDYFNDEMVLGYFDKVCSEEKIKVALDLAGVTYINSIGMGTIKKLFVDLKKNGGRLVVYRPNPQIRKVFEITKINRFIPIYPSETEALENLI